MTDTHDYDIKDAIYDLAAAITPSGSHICPAQDATGGYVGSLTEAVMGISSALVRIAEALEDANSQRGLGA